MISTWTPFPNNWISQLSVRKLSPMPIETQRDVEKQLMKTSSVTIQTSARLSWNTNSYDRDKLSTIIQETYRPLLHLALSILQKLTKIFYTLIPHCIRNKVFKTRCNLLRYLSYDIRRSNNGVDKDSSIPGSNTVSIGKKSSTFQWFLQPPISGSGLPRTSFWVVVEISMALTPAP
jgi:hypothetical protein